VVTLMKGKFSGNRSAARIDGTWNLSNAA
jgi:hypothetical protein